MEQDPRLGNDGLLFVAVLVVLSALAIWFVEAERPRREVRERVEMTQTSVDVNVRAATVRAATSVPSAVTYGPLATAQSHRTATAQVRQTSFANERRTAAADSRSTATARAYRTVSARYIVTAKTGLVATSRIRTPTADFRRTSVAQTRLTAAVLAPTVPHRRVVPTVIAQARLTVAAPRSYLITEPRGGCHLDGPPTLAVTARPSLFARR